MNNSSDELWWVLAIRVKLKKRSSFPFSIIINFSADDCSSYSTLSDADRKRTHVTPQNSEGVCDDWLPEGWYRFVGAAGTKMPTTPVHRFRCNTAFPGWLKGAEPTVANVEVSRLVCFTRGTDNCAFSKQIVMKNCGSYFIYKLGKPPICKSRYCSTDADK